MNEGVREGVNEGVKQRLARELVKICGNKSITRVMMERTFEISTATAERDIALLKEAELIMFEGPPKTGRYVLTEKGRKLLGAGPDRGGHWELITGNDGGGPD